MEMADRDRMTLLAEEVEFKKVIKKLAKYSDLKSKKKKRKSNHKMRVKMTDLDYVEQYALKLKEDNSLFKQQAILINSQIKSSSSLFTNMFKGKDFKTSARKHLRKIGLLKPAKRHS